MPAQAHVDIDLLYWGDDLPVSTTFCEGCRSPAETRQKRFQHKRAFLGKGVSREIVLVRDEQAPVTWFWGDVPYRWEQPLFYPVPVERGAFCFSIAFSANLNALRAPQADTAAPLDEPAPIIAT